MLEQRSDSLQVNTAQSQARVLSLEQEKVCKNLCLSRSIFKQRSQSRTKRINYLLYIDKPEDKINLNSTLTLTLYDLEQLFRLTAGLVRRSVVSTGLQSICPGFKSQIQSLYVGLDCCWFVPCSWGFFSGFSGFLSSNESWAATATTTTTLATITTLTTTTKPTTLTITTTTTKPALAATENDCFSSWIKYGQSHVSLCAKDN